MKASVLLITYNHEAFIAQAIESALNQRTSFDYEIVVGDDASTDKTQAIVREYQRAHPDKVKLQFLRRNSGGLKNFLGALAACQGEYIALLEGDDFWTSDEKLEKQVALLESRPDSSGCFANSIVVNDRSNETAADFFTYLGINVKPEIHAEDILPFGISPANTILFRRSILANLPEWYTRFTTHCGLDLLISLNGPYLHLDEFVGAYRLHPNSGWLAKSLSYRLANDLQHLKNLYDDEWMRSNYGSLIRAHVLRSLDSLLTSTPTWADRIEAARYFVKFLLSPPWQVGLMGLGVSRFSRRIYRAAVGRTQIRPSPTR